MTSGWGPMAVPIFSTQPWAQMNGVQRSEIVIAVTFGTLVWGALFLIGRYAIFPRKTHDFNNRMVSIIHVFVAMALSTWSVEDWTDPLANVGGPNSSRQMLTMIVSVAYFNYDFVCGFFEVPIDWVMCIHHVFTIMGFAYGITSGQCGTELVACLWLMETSNPCMHARSLLKELNAKDSRLATLNDVLFALTFTFARMLIGPYITMTTLAAKSPAGVKLGAVGIQLVSTFWFYKITKVVYHKVFKKGKSMGSDDKKHE